VHVSFNGPAGAATALAAVPTFALLGASMRRMRSRDRPTVFAWGFCGAWTVGGGWWASWALGLAGFGAAVAPRFSIPSLCALAFVAVACVALLHGAARLGQRGPARFLRQVAIFTGGWAAMFAVARLGVDGGAADLAPAQALYALAPALAVVALACAAALWISSQEGARTALRMWLAATVLAAGHALALGLVLSQLAAPQPAQTAGEAAVGATGLLPVAAIALMLVTVGLVCAWLDTHAHARNRQLAVSLNEANRRLREQALSDPLTRMPNRLMFEERLEEALAAAGQEASALAVLFIDLDGFKPINDSFGHVAGDSVLREIGRRLKALARPEDTIARVGGDEFLLMLVRPGHEAVSAAVAQRVLEALNQPLRLPNGVTVNLSASIGIVLYPEHGPAAKLIANADAAMYAAKRAGGSTYAFFEPRMELDAREQLALQNDLRQAIERRELQLYFQPKIDGRSGQVTGVESLLRWQHAVHGFVPPDRFIPIAERFGLIGTIGNWVIDEACRQLREWAQMGLRMRVSVNLSVHQLRQEDLVQRVRVAVDHFGIEPQLLTFEITESVAMEDTQQTLRAFALLANAGVSLSIDDFGTGYSSLSYLRKLPAKQLKIDRSFVQDLGQSPDALAVVDAVIKLAHALGLCVVAEGVETPRQRDILLGLQCDELQGYLFARPMAARALTLWAMGQQAPAQPGAESRADFRPSLYYEDEADRDFPALQ
jgi:diguanylate cyclase (GGDEF)-like protein